MPRGTPDGNASPYTYASQETDLGAIYQFLLGFSPINSQGRIAYFDTFKEGLSGFLYETNGGAGVPLLIAPPLSASQQLVYVPPNVVQINPGVTSGDDAYIERGFFWGTNTRLGLEVAVRCHTNAPNYIIRIDYRLDNNHKFRAELQYNRAAGNWRISVTGGSFQNIFSMAMADLGNLMIQIKIVADWSTGKYVRALIGEKMIDLSSYSMDTIGLTVNNYMFTSIGAASYGAGSSNGYIGYVLLTKDEP